MNKIWIKIKALWFDMGGYRDVLKISIPLIISMAGHTAMLFTDRLFLSKFSLEALAAAVPSGLLAFLFICLFSGIVSFANTFVAQYSGAKMEEEIGKVMWHGIYMSLLFGIVLGAASVFSETIFNFIGHNENVRQLEITYFRILMLGATFSLLHDTLASFYSGRGITKPVMLINLIGVAINIPLDYILIFGKLGVPQLGMAGSAIATVISHLFMTSLYVCLIFSIKNEKRFGILSGYKKLDLTFLTKYIKFGFPAGLQFFIDLFAFEYVILVIGKLGNFELAASNMAFSMNSIVFMPMLGFTIAVSTLVGQGIGSGEIKMSERAVRRALELCSFYMWSISLIIFITPEPFCDLFKTPNEPNYESVKSIAIYLMRFVAVYSILDTMSVIYSGALRGAGDTLFIGRTIFIASWTLLIIPVSMAVFLFKAGIFTVWTIMSFYICALALIFYIRFRSGKWKDIKLIEKKTITPPTIDEQTVIRGEVP